MAIEEHVAELALELGAHIGEGPVWDERRQELFFVDITPGRIHAFRPTDQVHRSFQVDRSVGAVVLREDGGLLLAAHDAFFQVEADGSGLTPIGEFRAGSEQVRFNDGKVDPWGRFVAGTMHRDGSDAVGSLYQLSGDGSVKTLVEGVVISNGLAWTGDGKTLYYIDTPAQTIEAFDVEADTGHLSRRRVVAEITDGGPDGMAIDDEGMLWVAVWGGSRVERIDPANGTRLAVVSLPAPKVSSVAFGGRGLNELYITTGRGGSDNDPVQPHAGDLFVVSPGVSGPPCYRFRVTAVPDGHTDKAKSVLH